MKSKKYRRETIKPIKFKIKKKPIEKKNKTLDEVNLEDILINYAEYYEVQLYDLGYNEEDIKAMTMQWIDDTISYYKVNYPDKLNLIIENFKNRIIEEEKVKRKK